MFRDTWMEVNLDAIVENVKYIKNICQKKFIAVLKADAYGCGDSYVSKAVIEAGADMIAVSSLDEALMLRNEGYDGDLLILGATNYSDVKVLIKNNISTAAYSLEYVKNIIKDDCTNLKLHLAYDTGMNRLGFKSLDELHEAFTLLKDANCNIEGIFTHFYCSDEKDHIKTNNQFGLFKEAVESLNHNFKWIHCDNSDATIFFKDDISNACRVGISLYGISPYTNDLKQVVSLYTKIFMTKNVEKGATIGYGATYTTQDDEIIGTLPIGYADGFIRRNQGRKVYVNGEDCEVVGRICMDQCMIRLPHEMDSGSLVEIFGPHISLEKMADELDTIPYEIICLISGRVTRKYIWHNQTYSEENPRLLSSHIKK